MLELHELRDLLFPLPPSVRIARLEEAEDVMDWKITLSHDRTGRAIEIRVADALEAGSQMFDILEGKRNCRIMTHVARIVGYFSFMHVWNRSKLAEARDRRRGDYGVPKVGTS